MFVCRRCSLVAEFRGPRSYEVAWTEVFRAHGPGSLGSRGQVHAVRPRVMHWKVEGAVHPRRAPEEIAVHPGYAAGRSEPPRGRLAMKSSTSCSTHRTARLPMRIGFGKRDSAISA